MTARQCLGDEETEIAAIAPAWIDGGVIHFESGDGQRHTFATPAAARAAAASFEIHARFFVAPLNVILRGLGLRLRQLADELAVSQRRGLH
jgi:hypothetical protein